MKKLLIGLLTIAAPPVFASDITTTCSSIQVIDSRDSYAGTVLDRPTLRTDIPVLIKSLSEENAKKGYPEVVSVNSHTVRSNWDVMYCVTSQSLKKL